jgi:serine/threonine protein kinase
MAEVYEATLLGAEGFARPVAIKRMLPAVSADPSFGQMFVNEARLASLLHHVNIVSVYDFERDADGRFVLVMELVRGVDLRQLLRSGPLPVAVSAYVVAEVLAGLAYAHELERDGRPLGIVHRDVSPHNVMVTWDGGVKLVDFGIAKAVASTGAGRTETGVLKGKMAYMSPEQAHGVELDGRSDVFSTGAMFHELLTGQRLFGGHTEPEVLARLLTQPIPRVAQLRRDVPADLDAVVMRMLERDRRGRFAGAHDARDALLGTSAMDPRAELVLRDLLRERFPGQSPRRRASGEAPIMETTPSLPTAAHSSSTATRVDRPRRTSDRAAVEGSNDSTRTAAPPWNLASGLPTPNAPPARPIRTGLWIAVALGAAALTIGAALLVARGGDAARDAAVPSATPAPPAEASGLGAMTPAAGAQAGATTPAAGAQTGAMTPAAGAQTGAATPAAGAQTGAATPAAGASGPAAAPAAGAQAGATTPAPTPGAGSAIAPPSVPPATSTDRGASPGLAAKPATRATGTLHVFVRPWAEVHIDGVAVGRTPLTRTLPAGSHVVRLVNVDLGKDKTSRVTISGRDELTVREIWTD